MDWQFTETKKHTRDHPHTQKQEFKYVSRMTHTTIIAHEFQVFVFNIKLFYDNMKDANKAQKNTLFVQKRPW